MISRFLLTLTAVALLMPVSVSANAMKDSLHAFFAKGIRHQGATAEFIEVTRWPDTTGSVRWRLPQVKRHTARISMIAEQGEGQQLQRWYVPVRVHWWANAVVLKQETPIRSLLLPDMLEVKRRDVAGHIGLWWKKVSDLAGMQVTRPMHKGDTVYSVFVKQTPMIKRGDIITIIAQIGGISVHADGKAMKSGGRGDRLLVQNLHSKQMLQATIVDARTVHVFVGGAG
ncbi:MAG: flagellar basal body P-ring formation chaperone FlgA [Mariprofundaceae bacterium]